MSFFSLKRKKRRKVQKPSRTKLVNALAINALPEERIQSLKFSLCFINRNLTKHELLYGSSNCDQNQSPQKNFKYTEPNLL